MEFNNYTEEEIEKILESNLEKKAYKKDDKAPKKLNVDDDEWLIEDGVVRRYRGHKKNLFVPEGVITLATASLKHKELETVYLPNTLKNMLDFCLADNNLEEIDLPLNLKYIYPGILYGNKITKLKLSKGIKTKWVGFEHPLPTSLKELEFFASDFMENFYYIKNTKLRNMNLETIIINFDNKDKIYLLGGYYSAFEFLDKVIRDFPSCVNNLVIYNTNISVLDQLKLKAKYSDRKITFKSINPITNRKPSVIYGEEKQESESLDLDLSVKIINSILKLIANLDTSLTNPILKEIAHIISNYQNKLKAYEPEALSLSINLKLDPLNKEVLYNDLISSLNSILTKLQNNPILQIFLQVTSYKINIEDNQTLDIATIKDAQKNLSLETYKILLNNLNNYFDNILNECIKKLPLSLNNQEINFNYSQENLIESINNYTNYAYHYEKFKKQIKGEYQTPLSQFLEDIKLIVSNFSLELKEKYLTKLESIITDNLEYAERLQYDYDALELNLRIKLHKFLEEIKQELEYIKTNILIETFKEAFNILNNKEENNKENPINELIKEIQNLINYPLLDETKKELYTHLLDNILKEINEVSSLSASEFNDYLLKEGITYPKNANPNYLNLSISNQFTIHILNKLYAIYLPLNIGVQELKSLYKSSNDIMRSLK